MENEVSQSAWYYRDSHRSNYISDMHTWGNREYPLKRSLHFILSIFKYFPSSDIFWGKGSQERSNTRSKELLTEKLIFDQWTICTCAEVSRKGMLVCMSNRDSHWCWCSPECPVYPVIYPQPLSLIFVSVYKWMYGGTLHSFMSGKPGLKNHSCGCISTQSSRDKLLDGMVVLLIRWLDMLWAADDLLTSI